MLNVILGRVATKSDGSLSLSFSTSEMDAAETTVLLKLTRMQLKMLLTPVGVPVEAPVEVKSELSTKTHSARLRGVLFIFWKQQADAQKLNNKTWETFYSEQMERMIGEIKSQLEPE